MGASERKRRRNKSAGTAAKRRRSFQFDKEDEVPEDDQNGSGEEEFLEKNGSDIYQAEGESTQNYFVEESESVLQEQQTYSNEIAFSGIDSERSGENFDMTKPDAEKESAKLPGHSALRWETLNSEEQNSSGK